MMRQRLKTWSQRSEAWYMQLFKLPVLPERIVTSETIMRNLLSGFAVNPCALSEEDTRCYIETIRQPGAATAGLNWYRAALGYARPALPKVCVPTLVIRGEQDEALGLELLDGLESQVEALAIERIPHAGHWLQQDAAAEVSESPLTFLGRPAAYDANRLASP